MDSQTQGCCLRLRDEARSSRVASLNETSTSTSKSTTKYIRVRFNRIILFNALVLVCMGSAEDVFDALHASFALILNLEPESSWTYLRVLFSFFFSFTLKLGLHRSR